MTKRHQPHHQLYPYAPLPCKIVMHIQQYSPKYHKKETSLKPSYHNIIGSLPFHSKKVTQSLKKNSHETNISHNFKLTKTRFMDNIYYATCGNFGS